MRIMIVDGQGGGIGKVLIEAIRASFPESEILAVGTNAAATTNMLRGGASAGATGENAVCWNAGRADIIAGPMGVYFANAMLGEITPAMALALAESNAEKIAIPVSRCHIHVAGVTEQPLGQHIAQAVDMIKDLGLRC